MRHYVDPPVGAELSYGLERAVWKEDKVNESEMERQMQNHLEYHTHKLTRTLEGAYRRHPVRTHEGKSRSEGGPGLLGDITRKDDELLHCRVCKAGPVPLPVGDERDAGEYRTALHRVQSQVSLLADPTSL